MTTLQQSPSIVKVAKTLTAAQAADLRREIYATFPHLAGNVQIVTACGKVQVAGVRGYIIDPATADRIACLIIDFDQTPTADQSDAFRTYLDMVAVSGYKAPSKRSKSLRRKAA